MYRGASVHSHDLMPLQHVLSAALQAGICLGWPLSRIRLQIKDSAIALAPLEQLYIGGTLFGHLHPSLIRALATSTWRREYHPWHLPQELHLDCHVPHPLRGGG